MEVQQLSKYDVFLKVAEVKSISRAAEMLNYTQSGISRVIASLEEEVGFDLFIRSSNGVTLTSGGMQLVEPIQRLVNQRHNFEQTVAEIHQTIRGTLRIGTFTSVSICWLPKLLRLFQQQHPNIEFKLMDALYYSEIERWIQQGRIDCGFLVAPTAPGLESVPLLEEPMLVLMPEGHPLADKAHITLDDLAEYPFISPKDSSSENILPILKPIKSRMNLQFSMNNELAVITMVRNEFGITIMPELIVKTMAQGLVAKRLDPSVSRTLVLSTLPKQSTTALTKTFVQFVRDIDFHTL